MGENCWVRSHGAREPAELGKKLVDPAEWYPGDFAGSEAWIYRLSAAEFRTAGECVIIIDQMDTAALRPGTYTYRMMIRNEGSEPLTTEAEITLQPAAGLGGTARSSSARPDMRTRKP